MTGPPRLPAVTPTSAPRVALEAGAGFGDARTNVAVPAPHSSAATPKVCPSCGVRYPVEFRVCPRCAVELGEADADADRDPIVGSTLGGSYTVVRVLGEGGMGRVYEARHVRLGSKRFAIKMLHPEFARQPEVIARFQREAEAASAIQSPYVVDVYDVDRTADGRPYLVGEFLEGKEFADYLNEVGKMPVAAAVRVVRQICQALAAAHERGVVHRDMKPENVFLTGDPAQPVAKVIDFGISKVGDAPGTALTKTGMIMGTPAYMAPEQARGEKVDHRADIYAVGAILYCAVTGRRPFDRDDPTATLMAVLTEDPPRPRALDPTVPEGLEMIIQRAMAKSPEDRHATMAELDAELLPFDAGAALALAPGGGDVLAGVPSASPTLLANRTTSVLDRATREAAMARPLIVLLSVVGALALVGGLVDVIAAVMRMGRDDLRVTGAEAALLALGVVAALGTPTALAVRHIRRSVWNNSVKAVALSEKLRRAVVVGLFAYGFASLLVRVLETVILRKPAGPAWPVWDVLLFAIAALASLFALGLLDLERKPPR